MEGSWQVHMKWWKRILQVFPHRANRLALHCFILSTCGHFPLMWSMEWMLECYYLLLIDQNEWKNTAALVKPGLATKMHAPGNFSPQLLSGYLPLPPPIKDCHLVTRVRIRDAKTFAGYILTRIHVRFGQNLLRSQCAYKCRSVVALS